MYLKSNSVKSVMSKNKNKFYNEKRVVFKDFLITLIAACCFGV
jgi:hypothetical protein